MSTEIKKQRIRTGLTQEEAAVKIGIHPTTLNKYEGGSRIPSGKVLSVMSKLFRVPMDTLLEPAHGVVTRIDSQYFDQEEESMYRLKFEQSQAECIELHKEISALKDSLLKKVAPSKAKKQA